MDYKAETDKLLKASGAILKRDHKHEVFALPNGATFVRAKTPSSINESRVDLATLRRLLGLQTVHVEGERRPKTIKAKVKSTPRVRFDHPLNTGMADKLLVLGIVDNARQTEITALTDALFAEQSHSEAVTSELTDAIVEVDYLRERLARPCVCFGCRWSAKARKLMRRLMLLD